MELALLVIVALLYVFGLPALVVTLWIKLKSTDRKMQELEGWFAWVLANPDQTRSAEPAAASPVPEAIDEVPDSPKIVGDQEFEPAQAKGGQEATTAYAAHSEPTETIEENAEEIPDRPSFSLAKIDFEDIFGRRLPIWLGGIALAISGIFLVRYAIEYGMLTPTVRVVLAFAFGIVLLAAAETAYRNEHRIEDARVRQALAGAGLATLYAGFYLAGTQYGLIGQAAAFVGLAAVTGSAIALSFRFGFPSAVLGLVGGFAAPTLVGGEEANLPVLALYLGLVTGGLCLTGRQQRSAWMGIAALIGGLGWGVLLLLGDEFDFADVLALGLYFVMLGTILPALVDDARFERPLRLGAALVASLQLAVLVTTAGYQPLAWGLYLLLGTSLVWFSWKREDLRITSSVAALIGILLFAMWPNPDPILFTAVGASIALIFAGASLLLISYQRDGATEWGQVGLVPVALATVSYETFGAFQLDTIESQLALATLALTAFPALAAYRLASRDDGVQFVALAGIASALFFAALLMVTPGWCAPLAAVVAMVPLIWLAYQRDTLPKRVLLWIGVIVALMALIATPQFFLEIEQLGRDGEQPDLIRALLRWGALLLPVLALKVLRSTQPNSRAAEIAIAVFAYGMVAQILPAIILAWVAALAGTALYFFRRDCVGGYAALSAIALLWSLHPLGVWTAAAIQSLVGSPVLMHDLPALSDLLSQILPVAVVLGVVRFPPILKLGRDLPAHWLSLPLGMLIVHVLYRQLFGVDTMTEFVDLGMAERTIWQAALVAAAWFAASDISRFGPNKAIAIALALASFAHFTLYSLWWHNPMSAAQAVGATPLANLLLAAYSVAIITCLLLRRWLPALVRPIADGAIMFLATLGALALLRQMFGGSTPFDVPMSQSEDLLRSLIGIVMALAFLLVGARLHQRSWRIGSLVMMLAAVLKVFLLDAAGLEGLLRIASFAALGASLIGLGWFYTRQLRSVRT